MISTNTYDINKKEINEAFIEKSKRLCDKVNTAEQDYRDGFYDLADFLDKLTDISYECQNDLAFIKDVLDSDYIENAILNEYSDIDDLIDTSYAIIDNSSIDLNTNALERFCKNIENEKARFNDSMSNLEIQEE